MNHDHALDPEGCHLFALRIFALLAVAWFIAHASGCDEGFMGRPGDGQSDCSVITD